MKHSSYDLLYETIFIVAYRCHVCNHIGFAFRLDKHIAQHIRRGDIILVGNKFYRHDVIDEVIRDYFETVLKMMKEYLRRWEK